ncbi:MAG: SDR family NAD(P)-dependent oxidoreductase [Gammaproteobacteria bacterium]
MNYLITGHSSGLGRALADHCLNSGHAVFGLSRSLIANTPPALRQQSVDLSMLDEIQPALDKLVPSAQSLDIVILNAGVLGPISAMPDIQVDTIRRVMDVNVWANKIVLDWLVARPTAPRQAVLISSGAGVRGNRGWSAYALSKATLNMLVQLYAHDMPDTQLVALAPGLIDTAMQAQLREVDSTVFPSVRRMHEAHGTGTMPAAETVAERLLNLLPHLHDVESGSFIDMRKR